MGHTTRFNGARRVCEGQVGPIGGLLGGRRANLNASGLAMHARDYSSPGQSPGTSLERCSHGA
jgi:hypothetical protein